MATNVTNEAESNLIKKADVAKVRQADFVYRFAENGIKKLMEALGITRKIPMAAGTELVAYKASGTLESGVVDEGEIIPLSKFATEKVSFGTPTLNKWRKATSAEAILKSGYDHAVGETDKKMISKVQNGIRTDFFNFLAGLEGVSTTGGADLQAALAQAWGQLQVKFEDDSIEACYFVNPLDIADYLASASISTQTAFGFKYVEDFLGLGTVIITNSVAKGNIFATAKENLVLYYIPVSAALGDAFQFVTDESGFIGIHEEPDYERMQCETVVASGILLFVERVDGVVVSLIDATPSLGDLTVSSVAGTASGDTKITVTESKGSGNSYKYKVGDTAASVVYGQNVKNWTSWDGSADITAATGKKIVIVECDANYRAQAAGSATVTAKA